MKLLININVNVSVKIITPIEMMIIFLIFIQKNDVVEFVSSLLYYERVS
jgi:hypothetical protein